MALAADEKYLVLNRDNLKIRTQAQLSRKEKKISQFLSVFLKSRLNFTYFRKKMTLLDFVFPIIRTSKT